MSDGSPNAWRSSGSISVSNAVPSDAYSASLYPPAGLSVSATTMAEFVIATTRAARYVGAVQSLSAFAFSCNSCPTTGLLGIASNEARDAAVERCNAARAPAIRGRNVTRSRSCIAISYACDAGYRVLPTDSGDPLMSNDAPADGTSDGDALGDAVPVAVKSKLAVAEE